ncbi:MAG: hypothetical protein QXO15_09800 [Nitrososphaerota archaeon]
MARNRIEDLVAEAIYGSSEEDDLEKLAAELTQIQTAKVKQELESEKRGEAFARGFLKVLKEAGISPKDSARIFSLLSKSGEVAPEAAPEASLPTDVSKEPVPNPLQATDQQALSEEELQTLIGQIGTPQDVTAQTGQAQGKVEISPEKEVARKIVEVANGLMAEGIPKDVAIEAAKAAVTAPETVVSKAIKSEEAAKQQLAATSSQEAEEIAKAISDAVAELEAAITTPVEEALAEEGVEVPEEEEEEEEEISPEELAKAAWYYYPYFYPYYWPWYY